MIVGLEKSAAAVTLVELESCNTKPSIGSLALTSSFGMTYLILYTLSSKLRSSSLLRKYVISSVSAPEYIVPPEG